MPYSHISVRQYVNKESPDELLGLERHGFLLIAVGVISPTEGYLAVLKSKDTVVANSNPMGISAEILEDASDSVEGRLAIDYPFLVVEPSSEDFKRSRLFEMPDTAWEDKSIRFKTDLKVIKKLALE